MCICDMAMGLIGYIVFLPLAQFLDPPLHVVCICAQKPILLFVPTQPGHPPRIGDGSA